MREAGIELTDCIVYNPGQPSYQAELISVLARHPDAIYLAGGQESGITVIKEAMAGGFSGQWLFTADLAVPEVFDAAGAEILNHRAHVEVADPEKSLAAYKAFATLHAEKLGGEPGPVDELHWKLGDFDSHFQDAVLLMAEEIISFNDLFQWVVVGHHGLKIHATR